MGSLKPNTTYIYEKQDGTVYAREFGADASTRIVVGWDWEPENNPSRVKGASRQQVSENLLWADIRETAKTNPSLQKVLNRAILIYQTIKEQ